MALGKGTQLGLANTVVIAAAIAATEPRDHGSVFALVLLYGLVPGIVTGAVLGLAAGSLRIRPAFRIAILLVPAAGVVALLGNAFGLRELIAPACIPTAASVLLLERWTRAAPDLPAARTM